MKRHKRSITTKLLILFLLVGVLTVIIVGIYSYYSARKALVDRTMDQLISVRAVKKQQLTYFFSEKIKNLENLYSIEQIINVLSDGNFLSAPSFGSEHLEDYCRIYGFSNLYLISAQSGIRKYIAPANVHQSIPVEVNRHIDEVISESSRFRAYITDLFYRKTGDSIPVCLIGCNASLLDSAGSDIIVAEIPSTSINQIMIQDNSRIGLGKSGEAYIVGNDHLMRSTSRFIPHSLLKVPVHSVTTNLAMTGQTGTSIAYDYRGIRVFSAYEPLLLGNLEWIILAEIDYKEAMIPVISLRNDIFLVSVIIVLFILGITQIITRMVTQPLIKLKKAASRLGEGDFDQQVHIHSNDEIGLLAETFNIMSLQIRDERRKSIQALYDGQELERERISRELHDGLGQILVGAKLQLENCDETNLSSMSSILSATKSELRNIIDELRRISNDLMPASLDDLGVVTALQNLASEVEKRTGIMINFDAALSIVPDNRIAVYLFRIAQEGINNAIRHAAPSTISIQLIGTRDYIIFILEDNGMGFDPLKAGKGNGLSNMKERTGLLGGTFSIESEPGKGTTLRVKIPNNS